MLSLFWIVNNMLITHNNFGKKLQQRYHHHHRQKKQQDLTLLKNVHKPKQEDEDVKYKEDDIRSLLCQ